MFMVKYRRHTGKLISSGNLDSLMVGTLAPEYQKCGSKSYFRQNVYLGKKEKKRKREKGEKKRKKRKKRKKEKNGTTPHYQNTHTNIYLYYTLHDG